MDAIEPILDFGLGLKFEALPTSVVDRVKLAVLDTLAATIAGARGQGVPELTNLVTEWGGTPQATLLTSGAKVPIPLAVLVNGVAGRAWDLDDVHEQNTCHVNVNIVPAALALAEGRGPVDGRSFLTAIAVGSEFVCRLSAAPRISFSTTGMSLSYQCGYFGVALTASRILGLDKNRARHAMGISYARLAGNQQGYIDGAMTVRLMQGVAPEGGVLAALMAERGLTGSSAVLEGKFGYFPTYHRGQYAREDLVEGLGTRWRTLEVSIKPEYPCCKYVHGPIEATVEAMREAGVGAGEIERIDVTVTNREVYDLVCRTEERKWNPRTVVDAQFSLPFAVAHAAVRGGVSLETFQPEGLADAEVRALMPRVHAQVEVDQQGDARGTFPMPGIVEVTLKSGRRVRKQVTYIKGHPKNPMTFDDVADKTRSCAWFAGLDEARVEDLIETVRNLEDVSDAGRLAALAAVRPQRSAESSRVVRR